MNTWKDKMKYLKSMFPELEELFKRGDRKYRGIEHSHHPEKMNRPAEDDIRHIREIHIDVRLREAEGAADDKNLPHALSKIASAIGYLVILHMRIKAKYDKTL